MSDFIRYSVITHKNPREIVMLRGNGCKWKQCSFCDYHLDASPDEEANFTLNRNALQNITGEFGKLEVINSGSFCELDAQTMDMLHKICQNKHIHEIHFETHWMYRSKIAQLKEFFRTCGTTVKIKIGVETFDEIFRESLLHKGMKQATPEDIARYCEECCLLFGISGQTLESMKYDIKTGLKYFERICINIMVPNSTEIKPDPEVIRIFQKELYDDYANDPRVDILLDNTDFGVGGIDYE